MLSKSPTRPPSDPNELREWRDATLYRLSLRASRAETTETLARLHARGHVGVTLGYTNFLANLDTEGTTLSALARRVGVTRQAAGQRIVEIEAAGYVSRQPDPADGRSVLVRQTAKGRKLLRDALDIVADLEAEYEEIIGAKRMDAMKATLRMLVDKVDPEGALGPN
jgi:DNA-binding MarR family transcriptional regulator